MLSRIVGFGFLVLALFGCASQDAIPEVKNDPKGTECGLAMLADGPSTGREIGSCDAALQQLDESAPKRKRK